MILSEVVLATNSSTLLRKVRHALRDHRLAVTSVSSGTALANLTRQTILSKVRVVVVDLDLPQLTSRLARLVIAKTPPATGFLFLWDGAEDFHKIQNLTLRRCRFISKIDDHSHRQKSRAFLTELTQGILDFASRKHETRILDAIVEPEQDAFVVVFRNGKHYRLLRKVIRSLDKTPVRAIRVAEDGSAFAIEQESGKISEVPWDFVLYHLEPEYQYFKGNRRLATVEQRAAQRIGRRLKHLRGGLGVTASELAARSGIRRPNISRLESGKHTPNLETLERLANALGVPVAELVR